MTTNRKHDSFALVGRFVLHFLELQVPMALGALGCYLLGRLIPASSRFATVYSPGTALFAIGDVFFLTVPVVAWLLCRGHGRRHSLAMALAMMAPVAAITVVGELAGSAYLLWLITAMYPAMCLGILVYLIYYRDHFTSRVEHPTHAEEDSWTSHLRSRAMGWSVSAVLAVAYVLVTLASMLLVGWFTTASWQAVFLGLDWNTILGFEIGLGAVVLAGFTVTALFVPAYYGIRRRVPPHRRSPAIQSWAFRVLSAALVLPAVTLVALRVLTPVLSSGAGGWSQPMNMDAPINSAHREAEPSFTANGRTMYFNCYSGDICVSHQVGTWETGYWTPPERLAAPISTEYEEVEPIINAAGDKLYFTSIRPEGRLKGIPFLSPFMNILRVANTLATAKLGRSFLGGWGLPDVYVSYWVGGAWSAPLNLNDAAGEPHLNTSFADHCLFFSADGAEAFWTSTRPGGFGDNDIWSSRRLDGTWTEPENLGPRVNGPGSEHTSIPTPDSRSLYITATRTEGYGGEDIYITSRGADGAWGPLLNLGPLVNGPGDDRCPAWTPDFKIFLFDSVRDGGFGSRDLWWVYFEDVPGYPLANASAGTARAARAPLRQ